jgi:hypothetical protein
MFFIIVVFLFSNNIKSEEPCMTINAVSYLWDCPDGSHGYFSIFTDGCHVLIKYEPCGGRFREWFFSYLNPNQTNPSCGENNIDNLIKTIAIDFKKVYSKSTKTDSDVTSFTQSAIKKASVTIGRNGKIIQDENKKDIELFKKKVNSITNTNKDKEVKNDQRRDVKKDDK